MEDAIGLQGRVILVTGAGGIGGATAVEAAKHGATIALFDLRREALDQTVAAVEAVGGRAIGYEVDVTSEESLSSAIDDVEANVGPIYGVVPSAGMTKPMPAIDMPLDVFQKIISINLTGTFLTARLAARKMLPRGEGAMVLLGSVAAFGGISGRTNYCASKFGVVGMAKTMAIEWGPAGLRVNVVCPGPVDTPLLRGAVSQEELETMFFPRMPIGRLAMPEDEARAIVYLLSSYSAYVTGAVLPVDGGLVAGYQTDIDRRGA
jgi:NAD(P)-dependent dehydrogenase (short-subunit alcohol dehydrogenase family)